MKRIILLVETSRAFGRQLIIGIARYSKIHGPWSFYKEPIGLKSSIPHLTNWKPDGIIMRDSLITKELLKLRIPTILVIHNSKNPSNLPVIKTDSYVIAKMAGEHLLERGLKNFAYCGFDNYDWSKERKLFFTRFIKGAGYKTHVYLTPEKIKKNDWQNELQHVTKWVQDLPKPVGLFACNDDRGQHILEVCKSLNLKVPEEVAVIGVDNDPMICDLGDPPLTSIALNVESAGYEAAKLLDQLIDKNKVVGKQIMVTPSHIVQRQSTEILAVNDPEVASAILYIKNNAKNKILVKDVVKTTGVRRRTLEKRFQKTIHRSIYNEIRQVRVELISKLLIETDLTISQITSIFNFTDIEHISRYFKKEKGVGLREFRKLHQPH
ncbi:MAG: DNA-binding transcriptional regulator [Alphaproteobacteria bacterium]|nr:MAG: DNA-binding transcriptional regulator [Alphaproteobacteria bacterium]